MAIRLRVTRSALLALICLLAQLLALPVGLPTASAATAGPGGGSTTAATTPSSPTVGAVRSMSSRPRDASGVAVVSDTATMPPSVQPTLPASTTPNTATPPTTVGPTDTPTDSTSSTDTAVPAPSNTHTLATPAPSASATPSPTLAPTTPLTCSVATTPTTPSTTPTASPSPPSDSPTPSLSSTATVTATYSDLPLSFEPNEGQSDPAVSFLARGRGYGLYLTATEAELTLVQPQAPTTSPLAPAGPGLVEQAPSCLPAEQETALHLRFAGANPAAQVTGQDVLPGTVNYFQGHDPSVWLTNIPTYGQVAYTDIYPGVNLVYYGTQGTLEYDFQVAAQADPSVIGLSVAGAQGLSLDAAGNLLIQTAAGPVEQPVPVAYQMVNGQRQDVAVHYHLSGSSGFGFSLGTYDPSLPLVIDPVLSYGTYLAGTGPTNNGNTEGFGIATDDAGDAYVTGLTYATNFMTTTDAVQTAAVTGAEVFVTKLNPNGNAALYSTYLGGSGDDVGRHIVVDGAGNAYIAGYTSSNDFPTTTNALTQTYRGGTDGFVAKLNPSGSQLLYSTYLGGTSQDQVFGVAVDGVGHAYVTGLTYSTDFYTTTNALQGTLNRGLCSPQPCYDAFVTKLDTTKSGLASLVYSSYLGGRGLDDGYSIAVDSAGDAYVGGDTVSADFPTTSNALQQLPGNGDPLHNNYDGFVAELNPGGSQLLYSTYLGGSGDDSVESLALNGANNVYVSGWTESTNFYTSTNALQSTYAGGTTCSTTSANPPYCDDGFVTRLNTAPSGGASSLVYSTYLGSGGEDTTNGIAVDASGHIYVAGGADSSATSPRFPYLDPIQGVPPHGNDAFVAELSADGSALLYSTPLGGSGDESGYALALDPAGNAYVTGYTNSLNFATSGALEPTLPNNCIGAFVAKVAPVPAGGTISWHPHHSISLGAGLTLSIDLADGHADLRSSDMQIPGRGPGMTVNRTWDSAIAQAGGTNGWVSSLTPSMGGVLTGTVLYTDASGAVWPFRYVGSLSAPPPYSAYITPPGLPWQLYTSSSGYELYNVLTGQALLFDAQGRYVEDEDSYGNTNILTQGTSGPITETNSGGRALSMTYASGRLTAVFSPAWLATGGQHGQVTAYGYNGSGQLTSRIQGYTTADAVTTTYGYSGTQLTAITTPKQQTWLIGYDSAGRVSYVTSPASGTVGQAGYTPAYSTVFVYTPTSGEVIQGYNAPGQLVTYDALDGQGEPIATVDGLGHTTYRGYDGDHDVLYTVDANSHTTLNDYQYVGPNFSVGQLTETDGSPIQPYTFTNSLITPTTTYSYDPSTHDLLKVVSPNGGETRYAYDGHHSVITTTVETDNSPCNAPCVRNYSWRASVNQYDTHGERTGQIDGRGLVVSPDYNATVTLGACPGPSCATTYTRHWAYATSGDLQSESTPPITTTVGGQLQVSVPVTTTYGYDGDGNQTSVTSANGNTSTSSYDHLGRDISTQSPRVTLYNGQIVTPTTTMRYDPDGNVVQQIDANNDVTADSYDPLQRLTADTNPISGTTVYTYNATEQTAVQDPQGNVSTSQYDGAGRLSQSADPTGGVTQYGYDPVGNTTGITLGDGTIVTQTEAMTYNAANEVVSDTVAGPGGVDPQTTQTTYDLNGNTIQVEQPAGNVTYNTYNFADQLVYGEIDAAPVNGPTHQTQESFGYDNAGNQTDVSDFDNRHTASSYDGDNRVVQSVAMTGTATITTTNGYDPDGNTLTQTVQTLDTSAPSLSQTHTYTDAYNADDWATSSGDDGLVLSYGYDANGQQRSESGGDPTTITNVRNAEGLITATGESTNGTGPYTTTFGYTPDDLLNSVSAPNGTQQSIAYDKSDRVTQVSTTGASGVPVSGYGYDPSTGWATSMTALSGTDTLTYYPDGRLKSESGPNVLPSIPGQTYNWTYDGNGNVKTATADNGNTAVYTYSNTQPNELVASSAAMDPTTSFYYDNSGNTTGITTTNTVPVTSSLAISTNIGYDSQSRPSVITHIDGTYSTNTQVVFDTISMAYNALGQRAAYTVTAPGEPGIIMHFQYDDAGQIYQNSVLSGTVQGSSIVTTTYTDTYVYRPDGLPLELVRQQGGTTSRYWYVLDGQGSVIALVDVNDKVVDSYAYDLWGEPLPGLTKQQVMQQFRYKSYWLDDATGWYWVNGRQYDPEAMRFVQPDGSSARSYVYAGDDPTNGGLTGLGTSSFDTGDKLISGSSGVSPHISSSTPFAECGESVGTECGSPGPWEGGGNGGGGRRGGGGSTTEPAPNTGTGTRTQPSPRMCCPIPPSLGNGQNGQQYLFHYTDNAGLNGIVTSDLIRPALNGTFGPGQYFTDLPPTGLLTMKEYSLALFRSSHVQQKTTHWVLVNVTGLDVVRVAGIYKSNIASARRSAVSAYGIWLISNTGDLDVTGRIVAFGATKFAT